MPVMVNVLHVLLITKCVVPHVLETWLAFSGSLDELLFPMMINILRKAEQAVLVWVTALA